MYTRRRRLARRQVQYMEHRGSNTAFESYDIFLLHSEIIAMLDISMLKYLLLGEENDLSCINRFETAKSSSDLKQDHH